MPIHFEIFWKNTPRIKGNRLHTTIESIVCFISIDARNSHFVMRTFRYFRGQRPQITLDNTMDFISIDIKKLQFRNVQGEHSSGLHF
jgi:hypothetical protein